jgi:hypothetical protein
MKSNLRTKHLLRAALFVPLVVMTGGFAQAATNYFNFDSDPIAGGLSAGSAQDTGLPSTLPGAWISANGSPNQPGVGDQSTNGYWAITQTTPLNTYTAHGMRSALVFNQFDPGSALAGFTFACDMRVGGGSTSPADGFCVSFARSSESLAAMKAYTEQGTGSGLAICFDSWGPDNALNGQRGLVLKVDGTIVTNVAVPNANGACDDPTSLQTGPNDPTGVLLAADLLTNLCWQPLWINLDPSGLLNVSYKGSALLTNYPLPAALAAGSFVLSGRTGGSWQEQDVDNLTIVTVPATTPVVGPMATTITTWSFKIYDSGTATPNTNTITVTIDGSPVTPTAIKQSGNLGSGDGSGVTTVSYRSLTQLFAPNSQHTRVVHFTGSTFAGSVDKTNAFFVVAPTGAVARVGGYSSSFRGVPQYSANGGGHTGLPGDYAMDFIQAGTNNCVLVNGSAFVADLQSAIAADVLSISFWEKRRVLSGGVPSACWFYSPTADQQRGINLHCPYADERIFFDTGGLAQPAQRLFTNFNATTYPGFVNDTFWTGVNNQGTWRHIVAIKNHGAKQVWIDGYLFLNQTSGANVLYPDMNLLYIGGAIGNNTSMNALLDDFAIYTSALSGTDVTNLFNGTPPDSIGAASSLLAWWDFNDALPTISLTKAGTDAVITYSGTLQSSPDLQTSFGDVPGATTPYTNDITANPMLFFRARK